jgi:hypothetical protein
MNVRIRGYFWKPKAVREQKQSGKRCYMDHQWFDVQSDFREIIVCDVEIRI